MFQVQFDDPAGQQHQGRDEPKLGEALDEEVPLWRTLEAGVSRGLEVLHSLQNNLLHRSDHSLAFCEAYYSLSKQCVENNIAFEHTRSE